MLESIVCRRVVTEETFGDHPAEWLYPQEAAAVANAVDSRRREFATVRGCARRALARLGRPPAPIPPGPDRAPVWPDGVVGSMTHCAGYRACALAEARAIATLGIDAEPDGPLPDGVLPRVADAAEREHLDAFSRRVPAVHADRLLFCAKEAVYKAWFPLAHRWLGFEDAEVTIDPGGTFTARLRIPGPLLAGEPLTGFTGRWLAADGLVLAVIARPARPCGAEAVSG